MEKQTGKKISPEIKRSGGRDESKNPDSEIRRTPQKKDIRGPQTPSPENQPNRNDEEGRKNPGTGFTENSPEAQRRREQTWPGGDTDLNKGTRDDIARSEDDNEPESGQRSSML